MKVFRMMLLTAYFAVFHDQTSALVYMWQMHSKQGDSCCLHIKDIDICSPYQPCTKFLFTDLGGIFDYTSRILSTDKGKIEPHFTLLSQIQKQIRSIMNNPYKSLSYQLDHRKVVPFFHDVIEAASKVPKQVEKPKSKDKDDAVLAYLMKWGLVRQKE